MARRLSIRPDIVQSTRAGQGRAGANKRTHVGYTGRHIEQVPYILSIHTYIYRIYRCVCSCAGQTATINCRSHQREQEEQTFQSRNVKRFKSFSAPLHCRSRSRSRPRSRKQEHGPSLPTPYHPVALPPCLQSQRHFWRNSSGLSKLHKSVTMPSLPMWLGQRGSGQRAAGQAGG